MNRATPLMKAIARRLVDTEKSAATDIQNPSSFPVSDKLRPHLAELMGIGGVAALYARSLALACKEVPWLDGASVNPGGVFVGLDCLSIQRPPDEFFEAKIVLLTQMLGLLVAFVGPSLTSRLIGEVWPQLPSAERDFGRKEDREKAG